MTSVAGHMQSEIVIILVLVIRTYSAKNFSMYYMRYHIQQLLYYIRTL